MWLWLLISMCPDLQKFSVSEYFTEIENSTAVLLTGLMKSQVSQMIMWKLSKLLKTPVLLFSCVFYKTKQTHEKHIVFLIFETSKIKSVYFLCSGRSQLSLNASQTRRVCHYNYWLKSYSQLLPFVLWPLRTICLHVYQFEIISTQNKYGSKVFINNCF